MNVSVKNPSRNPSRKFLSIGPPRIRESKSALSTKSLGVKRINQYVLLKTLGTGISSKVVQCMVPDENNDNDDQYFAMKIIKRTFIAKN
jgi:hypothetical protein